MSLLQNIPEILPLGILHAEKPIVFQGYKFTPEIHSLYGQPVFSIIDEKGEENIVPAKIISIIIKQLKIDIKTEVESFAKRSQSRRPYQSWGYQTNSNLDIPDIDSIEIALEKAASKLDTTLENLRFAHFNPTLLEETKSLFFKKAYESINDKVLSQIKILTLSQYDSEDETKPLLTWGKNISINTDEKGSEYGWRLTLDKVPNVSLGYASWHDRKAILSLVNSMKNINSLLTTIALSNPKESRDYSSKKRFRNFAKSNDFTKSDKEELESLFNQDKTYRQLLENFSIQFINIRAEGVPIIILFEASLKDISGIDYRYKEKYPKTIQDELKSSMAIKSERIIKSLTSINKKEKTKEKGKEIANAFLDKMLAQWGEVFKEVINESDSGWTVVKNIVSSTSTGPTCWITKLPKETWDSSVISDILPFVKGKKLRNSYHGYRY